MKGGPLRVAAYCRVSTAREDQAGSLENQQRYFRRCIEAHPDWVLTEIYADEGVSGTSTRGREAFGRMLAAAQAGALDLILTKEVSRFARNTVDTLEITRRLKALGVGVLFLSDNIDTRDNDGELRLTIMASIAQEESRKTSERVRWGQRRRMEAGIVFGNDSIFGFDLKGGLLSVNQEQAAVVRRIYGKFLYEGKGTHVIARELDQEGVPPPGGGKSWSSTMVRRVLRNEKYAGDLLQKKYVTVDFLNHKKVENKGLEEKIYLPGHHEAIISRETWQAVQQELARRAGAQEHGSKYSNRYWCSGKVVCGSCGGRFTPRTDRRRDGSPCRAWHCRGGCGMRTLNEKALTACARFVLRLLAPDGEGLVRELLAELNGLRLCPASPAQTMEMEQSLRAALEGAEEVLAQVISGVTVFREFLELRADCAPAAFRLWYSAGGRGDRYAVTVDRWEQIG